MSRVLPVLTFFALCASALSGCATYARPTPAQMAEHETVVEVEGGKADLVARLQRWAAETYVDSKSVVQLSDAESGTIVVRSASTVTLRGGIQPTVPYRMTITARDGAVRFLQQIGDVRLTAEAAEAMIEQFADLRADALAAVARDDSF